MLTDQQKALRKNKITSSIVAGALGQNDNMSPIDAWLSCRGEGPDIDNKATRRGNKLENLILESVADDLGLAMFDAQFRSKAEWSGDSADCSYWERGMKGKVIAIGEGKSAALGVAKGYGEEDTDQIPTPALIQSHWHLIHYPEVDTCYVPVLVGGYQFEFRRYKVERNVELEGILWSEAERWHRDYVVTRKCPPASAKDSEFLKKAHPENTREFIPSTPELTAMARIVDRAREEAKSSATMLKAAKNILKQALGDSAGCKAEWGSATWTNNATSQKTNWEALARSLGATDELIADHTTEKLGTRVLRVNYKGEQA